MYQNQLFYNLSHILFQKSDFINYRTPIKFSYDCNLNSCAFFFHEALSHYLFHCQGAVVTCDCISC